MNNTTYQIMDILNKLYKVMVPLVKDINPKVDHCIEI